MWRVLLVCCLSLGLIAGWGRRRGGEEEEPDDDDATEEPADPHELCDSYLACVTAATPEALPGALAAYGPDGECWGQGWEYDQLCGQSCEALQGVLWTAYPEVTECRLPWPNASVPDDLEPAGLAQYEYVPVFSGTDQFGEAVSIDQFYGSWIVLHVTTFLSGVNTQDWHSSFTASSDLDVWAIEVPFVSTGPPEAADPVDWAEERGIFTQPVIASDSDEAADMVAGSDVVWIIDPGWITRRVLLFPDSYYVTQALESAHEEWTEDPGIPAPCPDPQDAFAEGPEPNDDEYQEVGDVLGPFTITGTIGSTGMNPDGYTGDLDHFRMTPWCSADIVLTLDWVSDSTDLDLALFEGQEGLVWEETAGPGGPTVLSWPVEAGHTYSARVAGRSGSATAYTLSVAFE